jgi:hypothetical protein
MFVRENFAPAGKSYMDTKHRVTIGKALNSNVAVALKEKIDSFDVFVGDEGDILLRPLASVPANEAWVYHNPKVINKIKKGLESARRGEIVKVNDIDKFVDKL